MNNITGHLFFFFLPGGIYLNISFLLELEEISAEIDADFDISFEIVGFEVITNIDGLTKMAESNSNGLTDEQKELLNQIEDRGIFIIRNTKCKGPDGMIRNLGTLTYSVYDQ